MALHGRQLLLLVLVLLLRLLLHKGEAQQQQQRRHEGLPRFAIGVVVCSGLDYKHRNARFQLMRAEWWLRSLDKAVPRSPQLDRVVLQSGFRRADFANQSWDRILDVPQELLSFKPRRDGDRNEHHESFWVDNNNVQKRPDGKCTSLKLAAWNRTEYDGIVLSDADVCFTARFDLVAWLMTIYRRGAYFQADTELGRGESPTCRGSRAISNGQGAAVAATTTNHHEHHQNYNNQNDHEKRHRRQLVGSTGPRCYDGFNTHMMFLRPDKIAARLLLDKARFGDFVPYTNTEQDVLETVFSSHAPETNMHLRPIRADRFSAPIPHFHHRGMPGAGNCKPGQPRDKSGVPQDRNRSAEEAFEAAAAARASEALYVARESVPRPPSPSAAAPHGAAAAPPPPLLSSAAPHFAVALVVCRGEADNANQWLKRLLSSSPGGGSSSGSSSSSSHSQVDLVAITSAAFEGDVAKLQSAGRWTKVVVVPAPAAGPVSRQVPPPFRRNYVRAVLLPGGQGQAALFRGEQPREPGEEPAARRVLAAEARRVGAPTHSGQQQRGQ